MIWLAGVPGGGTTGICKRERELNSFWRNRLWSYYHLKDSNGKMKRKKNKVNLFLDSGAFSAWSQGEEIDIQEYIEFIKEHKDVIEVYANLDVIGDPEATWENQLIMEEAGLSPLPCFHYGSPEKYLKRYVEKYEYISLGGMVPVSTPALIEWLDPIWTDYITDSQGMPKVKVHGFGLTSLKLMMRYPWYSVDSTSWVVTGRLGSIYVPRYKKSTKQWVYDENSWKVSVSNKSPTNKESGKHLETLPPTEKEIILDYIHAKGYKLGKSEFKREPQDYELKENEKWSEKKPKDKNADREVEIIVEPGISNTYQLRDEMNIIYFLDLEKSMPKWPWAFKHRAQKGFF